MQSDGHVAHLNAENKQHREGGGGGFSQIHCKSPKITVSPAWTKQSFYYVSHRFTQVSMYKTNILQHSSGDGWMDGWIELQRVAELDLEIAIKGSGDTDRRFT